MSGGQPLTDLHRDGWLTAVAQEMTASLKENRSVVASCSALKRQYRDHLKQLCSPISFVYLEITSELAFRRLTSRSGHFMPVGLLDSQFADLEPPASDERARILDASRPVLELIDRLVSQ
jgi:gluconokinase